MKKLTKAFTMLEVTVACVIVGGLMSVSMPLLARTGDDSRLTQSLGNLRNLSSACGAYGADYNDRQYTAVPDESGMYGDGIAGACSGITAKQCIPQMILGWDAGGGLWGYWIKGTPERCASWPGNCGNFAFYAPSNLWDGSWVGSWRLSNCKAFNSYVGGKFYDKVFWAPKDSATYDPIKKYFDTAVEFSGGISDITLPTYCWSPAAMWAPDVLAWSRRKGNGKDATVGVEPTKATMPGSFKSPGAGLAQYPALKWRMWEHQWLQGIEGEPFNPGFETPTPWLYNQGAASAPAVMCFDGHTQVAKLESVRRDQASALSQAAPLYFVGGNTTRSYYTSIARDAAAKGSDACNAGILTVDGILGRDMLHVGD